jgi:hypothetical protein
MRAKTKVQRAAQNLLVHRASGFSIAYVLRKSIWHYLLRCLIALALLVASFSTGDVYLRLLFMSCFGMLIGGFLRDLGWFLRTKAFWPFTVRITNWDIVEAIAAGEDHPQQPVESSTQGAPSDEPSG